MAPAREEDHCARVDAVGMAASILSRLGHQIAVLSTGTAIGSACSACAMFIALRWLGASEFGVAAIAISILGICQRLGTLDTWQTALRFIPRVQARVGTRWGLRNLLGTLAAMDALGAALASLLCATVGLLIFRAIAPGAALGPYGFAALMQLLLVSSTATAILRLNKRSAVVAGAAILGGALRLGAVLALGGDGLTAGRLILLSVGVDALVAVFVAVAGWRLAFSAYEMTVGAPESGIKAEFIRFSKVVYVHSSLKAAVKDLDVVLIGSLGSAASAGLYRACRQLAGVVMKAAEPISQAIFPLLSLMEAHGEGASARRFVVRTMVVGGMLTALGAVGYVLLGPYILKLVFGAPAAEQVYEPIALIGLAAMVSLTGIVLQGYFLAVGQPGNSLRSLVAGIVVQLLVLFGLVRFDALIAGSVAYLAFYLTWFAFMYWPAHRALTTGRTDG